MMSRIKTYNKDKDYMALIEQAAGAGDYRRAAMLEQQRNAKIDGEGLGYKKTSDYAGWLDPVDYGSGIKTAVSNKASKKQVADLLGSRMEKAASTKGMEQWIKDDIYDMAVDYLLSSDEKKYESRYSGRIDRLVDSLEKRGEFEYAYENDPLYQAYAKVYQREGRRAAEDAIGLAAENTGGYASSYAAQAAQQARGYYASKQADKIPELWQLAYDVWQDEGDSSLRQLEMLAKLEQQEYDRWEADEERRQQSEAMEYEKYLAELKAQLEREERDYEMQRDALEDERYEREWQRLLERDAAEDRQFAVRYGY